MSSLLQIRDVPDEVRRTLEVRAAVAGQSLNDYLLELISSEVAQPVVGEVLERAGRRTERANTSAVGMIHSARTERDEQLISRLSLP